MRLHANKYHLKDLHQEIDLFDRKIAHCRNYEKFESEDVRSIALQKLMTKRQRLVKLAVEMASNGIEYDHKELPRSLQQAQSASSDKIPA